MIAMPLRKYPSRGRGAVAAALLIGLFVCYSLPRAVADESAQPATAAESTDAPKTPDKSPKPAEEDDGIILRRTAQGKAELVVSEAKAAEILGDLPPAEELQQAFFQRTYDPSKLGHETPRDLLKAYTLGLLEGDVDRLVTTFDLTTKEGVMTASPHATVAKAFQIDKEIYAKVEEKFGKAGTDVLAEFDVKQRNLDEDERQKVEEHIAAAEIFFSEDGEKAVVPGGDRPLEMRRKDGRWYVNASKPDAAASMMTLAWVQLFLTTAQQQLEIAQNVQTVEQLRQELTRQKETPLLEAEDGELKHIEDPHIQTVPEITLELNDVAEFGDSESPAPPTADK